MTKKSDAPAIRFKGFSDAWEQRKLGELALFNPKDELPQTFEYVDLESVVGTEMLSHRTEVKSSAPSRAQRLAHTGDLFYQTVRPYQKNNYLFEKPDNNYVFSTGYAQMRPYVDGYFLLSLVQSERFVKVVLDNCTGTSYPAINANDLAEIEVAAPSDESEAQKIGTIFRSIDNLITLHQRKFEKLTNVKKSMLEKMFPQNGSSYPEIRFKGFTDPWEQRKLGEMGQTYTGLSGKTKDDFGHGQARFVTYMNVFSNPISNPEMTEPIEIDPKQNEVEVGDVFFTTSSETPEEVGMSSILLEKRGKTYLNSFCFGFRPSEKIDSYYLAYMLRSESARAKITLLAQGISRYNISKNKVMEIAVSLPSLDEQKMIGQYFSQLDNLITLHQRKGKAAVSGCFLNCSSLEKSSAQSRTLELFGQTSNQEIKYIIDGLSILGGKLRNFCVKLIILLSYTRINDIAKYHISRNTECVHNIN